jgi:hypothetical protein
MTNNGNDKQMEVFLREDASRAVKMPSAAKAAL